MAISVVTIETPSLGDRSYIVHDGSLAAVVDPQRDVDRLTERLDELGLQVTHVVETHVHNDYVSGGLELARLTNATYVVPVGDDLAFDHLAVADGDELHVGSFVLVAMHTPGHTHTHTAYSASEGGEIKAVFTGGSMLYGTVGRTDLVSPDDTEVLTRKQYRSVRGLADRLDGGVTVHPTHGFGSFCSSGDSSGRDESTVAQEQRDNPALTTDDEDRFVKSLLAGLTAYPRYYADMAPMNRSGPPAVDLSPVDEVDADEVRRRVEAGEWVVDLRSKEAFCRDHLVGTVNVGLSDSFVTYLGWTMPWGGPITLVGDTADEVREAQRMMTRIGIERPAGASTGGVETWGTGGTRSEMRRATFADLAETPSPVAVLDVRRVDEWREGHLEAAVHIPFDEVEHRLGEVPEGEVWVHCASGYRASIAASLVVRGGHADVVLIDDDWSKVADTNDLKVVRPTS